MYKTLEQRRIANRKARQDRYVSGLCHCGKPNDGVGLSCADCKDKSKRYNHKHRANGLCACGRDPEPGKARCAVCRERGSKYAKLQRAEMITAYGGVCRCCGENEPTFLALDHVFDDGAEDRRNNTRGGNAFIAKLKKQGWPQDRFQLLCHNCNFAKRMGVCPHQLRAQAS